MNSLLTSIAGQFAKPLLLSGVLPVVTTLALLLLVTHPRFPLPLSAPAALKDLDTSWQITWATLLVLVAAMLLNVLNTTIARLLSGYPWHSTVGRPLTALRRAQFRRMRELRDGLLVLYQDLRPEDKEDLTPEEQAAKDAAAQVYGAVTSLSRRLNQDFPYREDLVLPTKLGNVIRNFEDYPREQYGITTVRLWPRLIAVIDARYAAVLDDAKTNFDFMLNCSVLFAVSAVITGVLAWRSRGPQTLAVDAIVRMLFFAALSFFAYLAAVERARGWGLHVKAAVDLYRRALLKHLEYDYKLVDMADEKERIWTGLSSQWSFPDMRKSIENVLYSAPLLVPAPPTSVRSANSVPLTIVRGLSVPTGKPFASVTVTLRVDNLSPDAATTLTIGDTIPPNWSLVWGSPAGVGGTPAPRLKSSSPLLLELDELAAGASCSISYRMQSLVAAP